MRVLGVSLGHDSSFALVEDGVLVALVEAERFFRQKRYKLHCHRMESGQFPSGYQYADTQDLRNFLQVVGKLWGFEYDHVAVQNQGRQEEHANLTAVLREEGFRFGVAHNVSHHLSHASLAYFTSPYNQSLVFSYDGQGNDGQTVFFHARGNRIEYLANYETQFGGSYNNLGFIIGVSPDISGTGSGKTMGLAAYGSLREEWLPHARRYVRDYRKAPMRRIEGLNAYGRAHVVNSVGLRDIPELRSFLVPTPNGATTGLRRFFSRTPKELALPGVEDTISHDLARCVQHAWTEEAISLISNHRRTSSNLCVVGGCALNGVTNYEIQQRGLFEGVHFVPNPTDCGLAGGAALYVSHQIAGLGFEGARTYLSPYLGSEAFDLVDLPSFRQQYPHLDLAKERTPEVVASLVAANRIVGVIRGRYEVGPRALGNRSILANPLTKNMRDILNEKVKHREWYRPFAPVAHAESASTFFTNSDEIPYMSVICFTKKQYATDLPSVTHVDGSARLQTVRREHNSFLHAAIGEFERRTGFPILLNTSFNPGGEPIVNYCSVGLDMLKKTELDCVLIEDTLFVRPGREEILRGVGQ